MELLTDVAFLSRLQFAITIFFHFLFVPLSIGLGLFVAISETRYYKSKLPADKAISNFWIKIFTTTFAIGVATGITMEFSFGTNWANYSRFVGDIFGAPLAAEALLAFFLESSFLGILLFARKRVSPKFYMVSAWLVWIGSCLSALWILIANSWMQTPVGYEIVQVEGGTKAQITDFWAAALNHSTIARYVHTVDSLLILGAFVVMAVGAYYLLKSKSGDGADSVKLGEYGQKFIKNGVTVGLIALLIMIPAAHMQAVEVAENQPAKLAAMEGQWEAGTADMALFGWVDEANQTTTSLSIPGLVSWLATGDPASVYPGLNDFPEGDTPPVNLVFQSYHLMILLFGAMILLWILAFLIRKGKFDGKSWPLRLLMFGPLAPFIAINAGWIVTEVGRQPWVVYNLLRTNDAISMSVSATELLITISLFVLYYLALFIVWSRLILKTIKKGPVL